MALAPVYVPLASYLKDPDALLDYVIDWSAWLGGDTINTSAWAADSGITVSSSTNTTLTATVWLSGGTELSSYKVRNRITTTAGRTDDRTIEITVVSR